MSLELVVSLICTCRNDYGFGLEFDPQKGRLTGLSFEL